MAEDYRPHLLIPEEEVEYVDYTLTARSKDRGVDRFEHGSKLSDGLRDIVDAYTRVQSGDSLRDEDIRIFEVVLPEGLKFSDKTLREFISNEGMTITHVRNSRHATVVSHKEKMNNLINRVGSYRDNTGSTKKFEDIDYFGFPDPEEKMSQAIRVVLENVTQKSRSQSPVLHRLPSITIRVRTILEPTSMHRFTL